MKPLAELLAELSRSDVRLGLDGEKLRVDAPSDMLTADLRSQLLERKSELIAYLMELRPSGGAARGDVIRVQRNGTLPLSDGQQRIYTLAQQKPESTVYNVSTAFRLAGPLDVRVLEQSLTLLQRRHEALRTVFREIERGRPVQRILPPKPAIVTLTDVAAELAGLASGAWDAVILRHLQADARAPFDLGARPPWRTLVLRAGDDDHVLAFTMHHIVFDGRSQPIFLNELGIVYRALLAGDAPSLPDLPVQYVDFAHWQQLRSRDAIAAGQLDYWRRKLGGKPTELRLPVDHRRPPQPVRGSRSRTFALPDVLAGALQALARREEASEYITLLAAFCALLNRHTGQEDLLVCSPFASRDRAEFEGLIGYLNTIVVMRADLSGNPSFRDLVGRVRATVMEAWQNQRVPLQQIAALPGLARVPLTRAMFSYQDARTGALDLPGVHAAPIDLRKDAPDFDLALHMEGTREGRLSGVLDYDADLFDDATIDGLLAKFSRLLESVTADPHRTLSSLPPEADDGEVEARLDAHPQIDRAVVLRRPGHAGSVAYLVLNEDDVPRLDDIRAFLGAEFPEYRLPTAFVTVDRMPFAADGSIDRAALPPPTALRDRAGRPYVAPRTPLERTLAQVWKRVLWLDEGISVEDAFADLGGHSLLSAQLVVELERELARPLPARALTQLGTIADMARIVEEDTAAPPADASGKEGDSLQDILRRLRAYTSSWIGARATPESVVVGLNVGGTRAALFWCLQRYQELTQLARYLGPDQPVYGMRNGQKIMTRTDENLALLASHYVDEILAVRPQGPYIVGGNCGATRVAFPMALELQARGHEVAVLFLHEKFIPRPYAGRVALMFGEESDRNPYLQFADPAFGWRKYYTGAISVDMVSGAHAEFFVEPNVQVLTDAIRRRMDELRGTPAPPADTLPAKLGLQRLPADAYRASFATRATGRVRRGEQIRLAVEVRNVSGVPWRSADRSGIALVNRWLDQDRRPVVWLDGRTPLPIDLAPAQAITLDLVATAPDAPGEWLLVLDLVDEGVTSFSAQGSGAGAIRVVVEDGPEVRGQGYNAASSPAVRGG